MFVALLTHHMTKTICKENQLGLIINLITVPLAFPLINSYPAD